MWLSGQAVMGKSFNNVFTGGKEPSRVFGRVMFLVWLWVAILLAGYIGGSITSVMTVKQLRSGVEGPEDLVNYTTVAPEGTTSDTYLTNLGIAHDVVPTYQVGLQYLSDGKFQAMVFDRPVLQYWLMHNPSHRLQLINSSFGAEPYGFVLQQDSKLRQQVNLGLLAVNEDGTYNRIYSEWFGVDAGDSVG
jgi:polar amino acid transport system substrate-binding protein